MRLAWRAGSHTARSGNRAQNDRDDDEDQRVGGGDAKEKAGYKARQEIRRPHAHDDADERERHPLTDDHVLHRSRRRAERQPDADLLRPLLHRIRHQPVDADRREAVLSRQTPSSATC